MKLINTRARSYNGVKEGETIELKEEAQIAEYLEAGFEKTGKEEVKAVVKDTEKKVEDEKKTPEDEKKTGKEEVK